MNRLLNSSAVFTSGGAVSPLTPKLRNCSFITPTDNMIDDCPDGINHYSLFGIVYLLKICYNFIYKLDVAEVLAL